MPLDYYVASKIRGQIKASNTYGKIDSWKNIGKSRGERIFGIVNCPFQDSAEMHNKIQSDWLNWLCGLAGGSKG